MSAFRDLRVLDFSQGIAGPMAAMLIADFDAEVVKIEPPAGDRLKAHPGYLAWNRNKTIITLDLETPAGLTRARDLIAGADVAVFDHAPGDLERLGLDAPRLLADHPELIHVWMPPYGPTGPWSGLTPRHNLLTALSGDAFRQGAHADQPVHLVLPALWYGHAVMGAAAIGAALFERSRSGRGQAVTVSGLHAFAEMAGLNKVLADPPAERSLPQGSWPHYRLYQCSDGEWLFLGALFEAFFAKTAEVMGLTLAWPDLEADPAAAREAMAAVFMTRPRREWLDRLKAADVPCAPAGPREAWFAGPVVEDSGMRLSFDHPKLGVVSMPDLAVKLSATPGRVRALPRASDGPLWPARGPATASERGEAGAGPLSGVRVLDLGAVVSGPLAGAILANFGADVIKVEPAAGEPYRSDGVWFLAFNRGKRGLGVDLKHPAGLALFRELARQADVVLDNYRFGVRQRLGIDYAALKAINPRIISCSINAYGDAGDRAALPGFDPLLQAESGMMAAQGGADAPVYYSIAVNDSGTSAMAAFGIIAALNARARSGEGQEVLTSLMAQSLTFQLGELVDYAGRPLNDVGGRDCLGVAALRRFYACADGWLALACETTAEAAALALALGLAIDDPARALIATRDGDLAGAIAAALAARYRDEVVVALIAAGVPAAPALKDQEAMARNDHWQAGLLGTWRHPRLGEVIGARAFAEFSGSSAGFRYPTPDLGQHSRELLVEFGLPNERIAELFAAGAVFEPGP